MANIENMDMDSESGGVLKTQLDADSVADRLSMTLANKRYNDATGLYETIKGTKPYLNDEGIGMVVSILKARISNNNQYSKLKADQIREIRMGCAKDVWRVLCVKKKDYELDIVNLHTILNMVDDALLLFLSRTETGGFLQFIGKLFNSSESYTERAEPEKEKRGIFG